MQPLINTKYIYQMYCVCKCGCVMDAHFKDEKTYNIDYSYCPKCGLEIKTNAKLKVMKMVSLSKWYNPKTWGTFKYVEAYNNSQ